MFDTKMVPWVTPERVYVLCKVIGNNAFTENDLRDKLEPDFLHNNTRYFNDYLKAAKELGLVIENDTLLVLSDVAKEFKKIEDFRRYCNNNWSNYVDSSFYKITKIYFEQNEVFPHGDGNIVNAYTWLRDEYDLPIYDVDMRAWRFWASFLGFGYLQNNLSSFLPNAAVFLDDIIHSANFEKGEKYTFDEFVEKIRPQCNIMIDDNMDNRFITYGVANGLRTLHDMKVIKMEYIQDYKTIWSLYPFRAHPITSTVTHVTVCK